MTYPGWQWDGTQWQPVSPPKKRRTGLIVTLALVIPGLVLVACIGGVALMAANGTDETGDEATGGATDELSTEGTDGQFEFRVTGVERDVEPPGEFDPQSAQGEYLAVTLDVANVGDEPREFDSDDQVLLDTDGREYRAAWGVEEWQYETVNPGNAIEVTLHYDVPTAAEPDRMRLHDAPFSGGVEVALPQ